MDLQKQKEKILCVFDMDFTICVDFLEECLFETMPREQYEQAIALFFSGKQKWQNIVEKTIEKYPPDVTKLNKWIQKLEIVEGMKQLLFYLKQQQYQIILLSGGNKYLAQKFLEHKEIANCFTAVFAQQMTYNEQLNKFFYQNTFNHCQLSTCKYSSCKAFNLKKYIKQTEPHKIFYFGDGFNDLCGISHIKKGIAFIRNQYSLHDHLTKTNDHKLIKCETYFWNNGYEIITYLKTLGL